MDQSGADAPVRPATGQGEHQGRQHGQLFALMMSTASRAHTKACSFVRPMPTQQPGLQELSISPQVAVPNGRNARHFLHSMGADL